MERYSDLFNYMVKLHGQEWVYEQCVEKGDMKPWEFRFWMGLGGLTSWEIQYP